MGFLKRVIPALTDSIDSTYGVVSHVNNFIGLNVSDTPFQIIKAAFAGGSILMAVLALLIPVISYLTQVLNIKLMPTAATAGGDNDQMAPADEDDEPHHAIILPGNVFYCSGPVSVSTGSQVQL